MKLFGVSVLALIFAFTVAPSQAHALSMSLVWGDPDGGAPAQVEMVDGGMYAVPLNTPAPAHVTFNPEPFSYYGVLYRVDDSGGSPVRIEMGNVYGFSPYSEDEIIAWPAEGSYELDIYEEPEPVLAFRDHLTRAFAMLLFADVAYAEQLNPWDIFRATLHFTITDAAAGPPACTVNCNSNVMFLPGFQASRLYAPGLLGDNQVWEPNNLLQNEVLKLDMIDSSFTDNIFTKDEAVIGIAYPNQLTGGKKIYASFITQMDFLVANNLIAAWEPIAYDWRLDYEDLLTHGRELEDGKIYYRGTSAATTSDPYIVQQLKHLASTSRTGKVTIIAHSNGGLLCKALLSRSEYAQYVDKVILVASPQIGTPQAIGGLLHGFNQGLPAPVTVLFTDAEARYLGRNMPTAYNLLPSVSYFQFSHNPVVKFDPVSLQDWVQKYGEFITTQNQLRIFMTDTDRQKPSQIDTVTPDFVSKSLYENSIGVHAALDNWTPPEGTQLITIAGWGEDTLSGIEYKKVPQYTCLIRAADGSCVASGNSEVLTYKPQHVIDGDGTVVESSAQWANGAPVTRYWVDLMSLNIATTTVYAHANIFEVPSVRSLLELIVRNAMPVPLPQLITSSRPEYDGSKPRLYYTLHSPLTLGFTDKDGNYTGSTETDTVFNVPGVFYERFGEVQWLSVPRSLAGQVIMHGTGSGSFALDVEEVNGNDTLSATTFAAIPSSTSTIATLSIDPSRSPTTDGILVVDFDGDGTEDVSLHAEEGNTVLPDFIAPEAIISVSTSTKDMLVAGVDETSETTVTKNATTTIVTDAAGNKTTLYFQKKFSGNLLSYARLTGINYGTSTIPLLSSFLCVWDKAQTPVSQTVVVNGQFAIEALYDKKKDKTTVIVFRKKLPIQKTTVAGLALIKLTTNKGTVNYSW